MLNIQFSFGKRGKNHFKQDLSRRKLCKIISYFKTEPTYKPHVNLMLLLACMCILHKHST